MWNLYTVSYNVTRLSAYLFNNSLLRPQSILSARITASHNSLVVSMYNLMEHQTLRYKGSAVAQWLTQRTCTQWTWVQLPLVPIWVTGGGRKAKLLLCISLSRHVRDLQQGSRRRRRFWHATQDCVAPYVDHILHRDQFWAISIASCSVRLWDVRSCCMVLSHVMRERPRGLLQSSGGRVTGPSWHLCCRPYARCAQKGSGDVTGLLQWVWVVPLPSGPGRFEQIGAIWYLTAFIDTTDQKHRSSVHLSSRLPSSLIHTGR